MLLLAERPVSCPFLSDTADKVNVGSGRRASVDRLAGFRVDQAFERPGRQNGEGRKLWPMAA